MSGWRGYKIDACMRSELREHLDTSLGFLVSQSQSNTALQGYGILHSESCIGHAPHRRSCNIQKAQDVGRRHAGRTNQRCCNQQVDSYHDLLFLFFFRLYFSFRTSTPRRSYHGLDSSANAKVCLKA